jgi:F-box associated protein
MPLFASTEAWLNAQIKQPSQSVQSLMDRIRNEYRESWRVVESKIISNCPLDNHLNLGTSAPARHSLGELDKLPNELIALVLLSADIPSLVVFRRVNRRAMQTVDSIPEYATIIKRNPAIISAVLSLEANAFDLKHLYKTLRQQKCSSCNDRRTRGLYLIDCRTVCTVCFFSRPEYTPCIWDYEATPDDSDKTPQHNQQPPEMQYPSILGLPLFPSSSKDVPERLRGRRVRLFDRQTVRQNGDVVGNADDDLRMELILRRMAIMSIPWLI